MKIVSFKVTDDISKHLGSKANKSEYLRQLIYDDMKSIDLIEKRLRNVICEYLGHRRHECEGDVSDEIDSILNM